MKTNKLHSIILIGVLVLLVVALFFRSSLNIRVAEATAPTPAWWVDNNGSFSQYDTYQFNNGRTHQLTPYPGYGTDSNIISTSASYDGVAAIGPTGTVGGNIDTFFTTDANASDELEWQCTELVKRFLYLEYGVASIGNTYGYQVVNNYATTYPTKFYKIPNDGTAKLYPKPGDVLSYGTSSPGHTALVQSVGGEGSGSATVTLLEQNASSTGLTYQNFQNWQFQNGIDNDPNNTNTVSGWLTPLKWNDNSPSAGTTHDQIISIGASSTTNAWAAGNESVSCGTWQPVTYHNDGSGWTKYLISYNCANYPYNLNGIVTSSSTNAWAVGGYYPGFGSTLAYHWTGGSSWSLVTSDNPDGTSSTKRNKLLGVALDGSGTPWAVGAYGGNGSQQVPLIEKWNGSKFANQSPALPSGTLNGSLKAISFSSSTNGWAIGGVGWWSGGWHGGYVIYQYNGSSWTPTTGADGTSLNSVTAISDSEAWAVGSQPDGSGGLKPLILHTTNSGSTWPEDTSFNGSYPTGTSLQSVSADSPSDVWIVGSAGSSSYSMHYDGSAWRQVSTPSVSGTTTLQGVAVNSGVAWTGGYSTPSGQSYNLPLTFKSL